MNRDTLVAILIITLATAIIGGHLAISIMIWRRLSGISAVLLMLVLSIVTSGVWFVMASIVFLSFLWSSDARGVQYQVYFATFDLLLHPCDSVAPLRSALNPDGCRTMPYIAGPAVFFLLSLMTSPAGRKNP
ncbi:MAG TPA: hypothetical protein VF826_07145 [Chloroflexia bacterium]|jgi:hypothetical protein